MTMNLTEIAEEIMSRCPDCGSNNFRVLSAEVWWKRFAIPKRWVLRVRYRCGGSCGYGNYSNREYDMEMETVEQHVEFKMIAKKKFRDMLGIE